MKLFSRKTTNALTGIWMFVCTILVMALPVLLGAGLFYKSGALFHDHSFGEIFFTSDWKPLQGKFGFLPFIAGSFWVTGIAVFLAAPFCLLAAIFLTQYSRGILLKWMHPVIDILAGLPSVIFGVWGILMIVPLISDYIAPAFGQNSPGYTILAAGIVLGVMVIPFILNILIEVFQAIPLALTEASLSLGATRWETTKHVILRKAFPGIVSAIGLGISRAFGETIAVLMVAGNVIQVPTSILDAGYPLPALIANNYGEMLSIPLYDSALMLSALILFIVVLIFNLLSRFTISRLRR
jgi:phosphate transport system permease protein